MRSYSYFPGCSSSEGTAVAYGISTQAIAAALDIKLVELEDWNCCGTTPYSSLDELESTCVAARNLALAEKTSLDLVTPCSACFATLSKANTHFIKYPQTRRKVNQALGAIGLSYLGKVKVRHLFEVIYKDIGLDALKTKVVNPLKGLKVAPYYGCQMVRPGIGFDSPENPQTLNDFVTTLGAEAIDYPLKAKCCGGSLVISELDVSLGLIHKILENAASAGAQCVVTVCPLCQTNLDVYQELARRKFKASYKLPVLFFTQLLGLALGIDGKALALDKGAVRTDKVLTSPRN